MDRLRGPARSSPQAAALLGEAYERLGRADEAVATFQHAGRQFGDPALAFLAVRVLHRQDRLADAADQARSILTSAPDAWPGRTEVLLYAAQAAVDAGDVTEAVTLLRSSLELDPTDSTARWGLIKLLLVRSDLDAAYRTFIDHPGELAVADAEQAKAWLAVHRREGLGEQLARGAVRLANQFPDDEGVVTAAVGAGPGPGSGRPDENEELDEELLAEVQGLVSFYLERWPDGAIKSISVDPEDPEGMLESIRQMVEVDPETARIRRSLQGRVARQELPLGVLASALHRSYTELLVKRRARHASRVKSAARRGIDRDHTGRTGTWFCCAR